MRKKVVFDVNPPTVLASKRWWPTATARKRSLDGSGRAVDRNGLGTVEILRRTSKSKTCVWRWQGRFMATGVDGLRRDKTRTSRVPTRPAEVVEWIIVLSQGDPPGEASDKIIAAVRRASNLRWDPLRPYPTASSGI